MTDNSGMSRRRFLRSSVCGAVGLSSLASTVFDLRRIAAAAPLGGDYRALVCVFLYGGNDNNNLIVPRGGEYAGYAKARATLALPRGWRANQSALKKERSRSVKCARTDAISGYARLRLAARVACIATPASARAACPRAGG